MATIRILPGNGVIFVKKDLKTFILLTDLTENQIIKQLDKVDLELDRRRALSDLRYFIEEVLGLNNRIRSNPKLYFPLVECHLGLLSAALDQSSSQKLILMPRGHLKSELVTISYVLWRIVNNPNIRVFIAHAVLEKAQSFLRSIKSHMESNGKFRELFGDFVNEKKWTESQIIVKTRTISNLKEPTVSVSGVGSALESAHYDLMILDDLVNEDKVATKDQIEKLQLWFKQAIALKDSPDTELIVIGCLVAGTKTLLSDGRWKAIEKFKTGERVVSYDLDKNRKTVETVEAMIPQGKADVYELKTCNHTIQATDNHPFLRANPRFSQESFEFTKLKDLEVGDRIVCSGYKKNGTDFYAPVEIWILGFMFGDGWITYGDNGKGSRHWITCFAKGVNEDINNRVKEFFENKFDFRFGDAGYGYYFTRVARVGRYLEGLGFKGKAKTKRIPGYVFTLSEPLRKAFLKGFVAADGWEIKHGGWGIELCNEKLIEDLKLLAMSLGYMVSNIYRRERWAKPPHSPKPILAKSFHISIGTKINYKPFRLYKIVSIKYVGKKQVYDLTVSNTHNFIANGLVVHNTRFHFDDLYGWILDSPEIVQDFKVVQRKAIENGKPIWPKKFSLEGLAKIKRVQGPSVFSNQYMNEPLDAKTAVFRHEYFKYKDWDDLKEPYRLYATADLALSEKKSADFTAFVVNAVDKDKNWHLVDIVRKRMNGKEIINTIFYLHDQWIPTFGIEDGKEWLALKPYFIDECKKRGIFPPIRLLKALKSKYSDERIRGLEPLYAASLIYHMKNCPNISYLEDELMRFPKARHDDVADALAYQLHFARVKAKEKKELDKVDKNKLLPRWLK